MPLVAGSDRCSRCRRLRRVVVSPQGLRGNAVQEPADLKFSVRTDVRPRRDVPRPIIGWRLVLLLAALGFVAIVGTLLARGADTAGPSTRVRPVAHAPVIVDEEYAEFSDAIEVEPTHQVFKCVDARGAVAYQSYACGNGERTQGIYAARPDSRADIARAEAKRDALNEGYARLSRMAGTDRPTSYASSGLRFDEAKARCDAAKAHREQVLRNVGLARTYDLLQQLDERVREACKGS